jgi:hypothetical protein
MNDEAALRDKLRKIEALFAGAATAGEKAAAGAAAHRIRARLQEEEKREKSIEIRFSLPDPWSRQMFIALCRRYGLRPYRFPRMRRQSVMVRAPQTFLNTVLWPEFQEINAALTEYLAQVTDKVIRDDVYGATGDADEVAEPEKLGQ